MLFRSDVSDLSIAVLGTGRGPTENPTLLLAVTFGFGESEGGHAEELMDHHCRLDRDPEPDPRILEMRALNRGAAPPAAPPPPSPAR